MIIWNDVKEIQMALVKRDNLTDETIFSALALAQSSFVCSWAPSCWHARQRERNWTSRHERSNTHMGPGQSAKVQENHLAILNLSPMNLDGPRTGQVCVRRMDHERWRQTTRTTGPGLDFDRTWRSWRERRKRDLFFHLFDPKRCVHRDGVRVGSISCRVASEKVDIGGATTRDRFWYSVADGGDSEDYEGINLLAFDGVAEDFVGIVEDLLRDRLLACPKLDHVREACTGGSPTDKLAQVLRESRSIGIIHVLGRESRDRIARSLLPSYNCIP